MIQAMLSLQYTFADLTDKTWQPLVLHHLLQKFTSN